MGLVEDTSPICTTILGGKTMAKEYIERRALLEDMATTILPRDAQKLYLAMRGKVRNAPTADVVEVVRCKRCKHWKDTSYDTLTEAHWGECRKPLGDYRYCETAENDFCSYGERREE
jgi:hypothetical protein